MGEMVERVAIALFAQDGLKHAAENITLQQSWEMSPRYHAEYRRKARAAIEAMREPTDDMIRVGVDELNAHLGAGAVIDRDPVFCWRAMAHAALSPTQSEPEK